MATTLPHLRRQAHERQCGRCYYCGLSMWEHDAKAFARHHGLTQRAARHLRATAEHLQARRDGGRDLVVNIVAACVWCNLQRHAQGRLPALGPDKYRAAVRARMAQGQ